MSLLKVNEVQNYNGSSLTLTASTVSTSAQLNTGGNVSVTGSINVSDDSTTRSNLGLGSIATQDSSNVSVTGGSITGTTIVPTSPFSFRNKIINGNFDIWQRGTSQTSDDYGSVDRWKLRNVGSTKTASQQAFTVGQTDVPGNPKYYLRHVVTSASGSGNFCLAIQNIEGVETLAGKTATLSFWAKADSNKNIATEFFQNFGTGGSPSSGVVEIGVTTHSLTTSWQKFTTTVSIPSISGKTIGTSNNDFLQTIFWFEGGSDFNSRTNSLGNQSGTFDIAQVQLEEGSVATPFENRPIGVELGLCQRYYFRTSEGIIGTGWNNTTSQAVVTTNFPTPMRTKPTALEQSGTASDYNVRAQNSAVTCASVPVFNSNTNTFLAVSVFTTAAATLNAGEGSAGAVSTNGFLAWSAEL